MGDISVIARRLKDGHVQHGWSGNGGYFSMVGNRLLKWYTEPQMVEYLFSLGQLGLIGAPNSEYGGYSFMYTHGLTGKPHYLGTSEDDMFSKIAFTDYGYLYDMDNRWYYIVPHRFYVKIPLEIIEENLDERGNEFEFIKKIHKQILEYILREYIEEDITFREFMEEKGYDNEKIWSQYENKEYALYEFLDRYNDIYNYFDEWIIVLVNEETHEITGFKMKRKTENHIETIDW